MDQKIKLSHGAADHAIDFKPLVISKLAQVEIADKDYIEDDRKYFTYEEALEVEKKLSNTGWRLPTRSEWALICEEFGQKDGYLDGTTLATNLKLNRNGWYGSDDKYLFSPSYGYYWSSTSYSNASYAYYLGFATSSVAPSDYSNRNHSYTLRLVKDMGAKNGQ